MINILMHYAESYPVPLIIENTLHTKTLNIFTNSIVTITSHTNDIDATPKQKEMRNGESSKPRMIFFLLNVI